jgi:SAM-dependent methyltransferase
VQDFAAKGRRMTSLPLPPPELRGLVGNTDSVEEFERVGSSIAGMMKALGLLEPGNRILDVGCGCGRVAARLLSSPIASYEGFDRNPRLVGWAAENIMPADPRFRFQLVSVESPYAELDGFRGTIPATDLRFPYADGSFEVALLASVFTHMPVADSRRYLDELARVLGPDGQVLATWFLTDEPEGAVEGLGYSHNRTAQTEAVRAAGFSAQDLFGLAAEPPPPGSPPRQEWFLLRRVAPVA